MSDAAGALLESRGQGRDLGSWVAGLAWGRDGSLAFGLSDGTLHLTRPATMGEAWATVEAHPDAACLALVADVKDGFLSGGDDGRLVRVAPDGTASEVARLGTMKWVEHVAAHESGLRAAAVGKTVHLLDGQGGTLKQLSHPSAVGGLAFDAKGKRIAASHYNGASLWFVNAREDKPRVLEWKGSHAAIAISPDGTHVVTAMQENALHGWRLSDSQHMRMSGYPAKTRFLSFSAKGKWLATSGAESVVLWPFFGGGPMGKAPTEVAGGDAVLCTAVAFHPQHEIVAAGFGDGLVVLAEVASGRVVPVAGQRHGPVSAIGWNRTGTHLAFGTETGFAALVDLSKQ